MTPHAITRLRRVAGASLALTSCLIGGAAAAQLAPPRQYTISPTNVNLLDNTYAISVTDLAIGPLKLERSYLGGVPTGNYTQTFGSGWDHNFDIWATSSIVHSAWLTKVVVGRSKYLYDGTAASNYPRNDEAGTTANTVGGVFTFTERDGTIYRFTGSTGGSGTTITSPDGSVTTISYVSSKPKTIVSNRGYAIVLDYGGNGLVSAACGYNLTQTTVTTATTCAGATMKANYVYNGMLTGVYDLLGNLTTYGYQAGSGSMTCVTDPASSVCKVTNSYAAGHRDVSTQTMADGTVWQYSCSCSASGRGDEADSNPSDYSGWTGPDGNGVSFDFNNYVPADYTDAKGQHLTSFYGRYLMQETLIEGNKVNFNYTARMVPNGNTFVPKPGSPLANITQGAGTYPSSCTNPITCNRPTAVTDANGNVTSYTYDQTHGGVLTETSPANAAGISAVVRHAYTQRYAWILNTGGGYSPASGPVWVLTEDRTCRTTATSGNGCAGGAADEVVTAYDYGPDSGPNNLLLRGKAVTADGVTLRTCYGYDWKGDRVSETSPRANLAACS